MTDRNHPPAPLDDDLTDYWLDSVDDARELLLDRDGEICNPSVFHPTQSSFENNARRTGNAYAPTPEQIRKKRLEAGTARARGIISERLDKIADVAGKIESKSAFGMKVGACMTLLGQVWMGLPIMALSAGAYALNKRVGKHGVHKLERGLSALDVCVDARADAATKIAACATLRDTARHIGHWEKTQSITATVVKFAFSEVHKILSGIQLLFDLNKDLGRPQKPKPTTSESLAGALSQVYYGLGVKKGQIDAEPTP